MTYFKKIKYFREGPVYLWEVHTTRLIVVTFLCFAFYQINGAL